MACKHSDVFCWSLPQDGVYTATSYEKETLKTKNGGMMEPRNGFIILFLPFRLLGFRFIFSPFPLTDCKDLG